MSVVMTKRMDSCYVGFLVIMHSAKSAWKKGSAPPLPPKHTRQTTTLTRLQYSCPLCRETIPGAAKVCLALDEISRTLATVIV